MSLPFAGPVRHVYVHIPFCRERCDYCDFASSAVGPPAASAGRVGEEEVGSRAAEPATRREDSVGGHAAGHEDWSHGPAAEPAARREDLLDAYVAAVRSEWERERAEHSVRRIETLYLGGGTPSLLGPGRLAWLLAAFELYLTPKAEVTVETNPEDVDEAYARWAAAPVPTAPVPTAGVVNPRVRVSLGVQSFDQRRRAALGRRAAVADPAAAFRRLRAAGVRDLSVDLIFGIPGQALADLDDEIAAVLDLRPDHVSWYELEVVEGTALAARLRRAVGAAPDPAAAGEAAPVAVAGLFGGDAPGPRTGAAAPVPAAGVPESVAPVPDDEEREEMYRRIVRALSGAGYDWYEVSNFALPGRKARHNVAYWRARPYLGLGAGAVSTVGGRRWTDLADAAAYVAALSRGEAPPRAVEELSELDRARERLMLAARCGLRVPLAEVDAALAPEALPPLADAGMISLHGGTIAVTRKGRYLANEVSVRLYRV